MLTQTSMDPIALDAQHVLQVYRRAPVIFESGQGCSLFTKSGERYLDLISGVGVASLGHGHPALTVALSAQAATRSENIAAPIGTPAPSAFPRAIRSGSRPSALE